MICALQDKDDKKVYDLSREILEMSALSDKYYSQGWKEMKTNFQWEVMNMEWINIFGLIFVVVIMIPNIIFAIKCKDGFTN